jgi:hypothetical protein
MLSRAQEARVQAILWSSPPGTIQPYSLEHLATAAKIPPGHRSLSGDHRHGLWRKA